MVDSLPVRPRTLVLLLALPLFLMACGGGGDETETPDGWEHAGTRWWLAGADTSNAFRNLDDLQAMGVLPDVVYASNRDIASQQTIRRDQLEAAVKRSLVRLYRNQPEIVDSVFSQAAVPILEQIDLQGSPEELVERAKARAYQAIRKHFREPLPALELGEDVPVPYPDSLRDRGVAGAVRMQVRVDEEGQPVAIELVEGVHPVLNAIAVRATTFMRWQPAYLLQRNTWQAIPSWSRFTIRFSAPPA